MTAYAQEITNGPLGSITWELRSVNHRYLEFYFRLPEAARDLEYALREITRNNLARGKLDCSLKLDTDVLQTNTIEINEQVVHNLVAACNKIGQSTMNLAAISPLEILHWPGVIKTSAQDQEQLFILIKQSFNKALDKLKLARQQEGQQLGKIISDKLVMIMQIVKNLQDNLPEILAQQKQRLVTKLGDLKLSVDENRLEQEYVYLVHKSDVTEEIERLIIHSQEIEKVCNQGTVVGKKLDFLVQELNREANTLASKSVSSLSSSAAVELKILIEQIREQVQNIE